MTADYLPTILFVDDNALIRELVRNMLAENGLGVVTAASGREALDRLAKITPDLIVTESAMPDGDGWSLLETIKADPHVRDVPVVFLSSDREVPSRVRALQAGAYDYLCKPFSMEELLVRIRLVLERSRGGAAVGESQRIFLSGHSSHLPIADLLQLLAMNGKTGCLRLRGEEAGRIHFREGRIVGAFTAKTRGRKALFRMVGWRNLDFHFDPIDDPVVSEDLEANTQRLLMDGLVALDDLARLRPELPPEGRSLLRRPEAMDEADADPLRPMERQVLEIVDRSSTLRDIMDALPEIDLEVARAAAALWRRGLLEVMPEGEAIQTSP